MAPQQTITRMNNFFTNGIRHCLKMCFPDLPDEDAEVIDIDDIMNDMRFFDLICDMLSRKIHPPAGKLSCGWMHTESRKKAAVEEWTGKILAESDSWYPSSDTHKGIIQFLLECKESNDAIVRKRAAEEAERVRKATELTQRFHERSQKKTTKLKIMDHDSFGDGYDSFRRRRLAKDDGDCRTSRETLRAIRGY